MTIVVGNDGSPGVGAADHPASVAGERDQVSTTTTTEQGPTATEPAPTEAGLGYSGTPWADLPEVGLAGFDAEGQLHLWSTTGEELGTATAHGIDLDDVRSRQAIEINPMPGFALADLDPAEAPAGCEGPASGGGVRVALCGGSDQVRDEIVRVAPDGTTERVTGPISPGLGHWAEVIVSSDGRWLLAQWSAECSVPSAWFVPLDGGAPRLATGEAELGPNPNSWAVGWTSDGRALVYIDGHDPACGSGQPAPGTYAIDPATGDRALLISKTGPEAAAATMTFRRVAPR